MMLHARGTSDVLSALLFIGGGGGGFLDRDGGGGGASFRRPLLAFRSCGVAQLAEREAELPYEGAGDAERSS